MRYERGQKYVLFGGNRSGKSESAAYVFSRWVCEKVPEYAQLHDIPRPWSLWVVTPTFEMAGQIVWRGKLQHLIAAHKIASIQWRNKGLERPSVVRLKNGVDIHFKSTEQGREIFQGDRILGAWVDEQQPPDIEDELSMRMLDYSAPMLMSMTPLIPDARMQHRYEKGADSWNFFAIDMEDNRKSAGGYIEDEVIDRELARIKEEDPELYETRKSGKFAALGGAIFPTFSRSAHVVSDQAMRGAIMSRYDQLAWYLGVDFGEASPTAAVLGAKDSDGRWSIVAEHYRAGATMAVHMQGIAEMLAAWSVPVQSLRAVYADTGDTVRVDDQITTSGRRMLRDAGYPIAAPIKAWQDGVSTLRTYLARPVLADVGKSTAYGSPRIAISEGCPNLVREMQGYSRPARKRNGTQPEGAVGDDHAIDALRMMVHTSEVRGRISDRVELVKDYRVAGNALLGGR